jgi:hypothetical protein
MDALKARRQKRASADARKTYDDAMRRAKMASSHDAAMKLLKDAKEAVADTPYELNLHNELERREAAHTLKVARDAYEEIITLVRSKPLEYDANIAAAEANLAKAKGSKYEALLGRKIDDLKKQRLEAQGKALYTEALAQVKGAPKEYAANVAALRELKAKAAGSRYEKIIDKLLKRQEALLARQEARKKKE